MKYLLVPLGSHGDVHPFVGLGKELAKRGHRVVMLANSHFRSLIENEGLHFVEHSTDEEFHEAASHPDVMHPSKGLKLVMQYMVQGIDRIYHLVTEHHEPGETIVVHSPLGFGVRIAQDKLGFRAATIHLAPAALRSYIDPPVLPMMNLPQLTPTWFRRSLAWMIDRFWLDKLIGKPVNEFRASVDLPPVKRVCNEWWNSPDLILCMFPDWFCPPPPDWPVQTRLTGFPLYDEATIKPLSSDVQSFLDAGDAPLIFTPGTANQHAQSFFDAALEACVQLNKRAIFLTRFHEQVPESMPETIQHFAFVPFSQVFPEAAAVIHHGGIGTTSQCLAAGVPQLIMPMGFDQPDNGARVEKLGVGASLSPNRFTAANVAEKLNDLLRNDVGQRCRRIAERIQNEDGIAASCDVLESLKTDPVVI